MVLDVGFIWFSRHLEFRYLCFCLPVSPKRILSVVQLPELRFDHLKLQWTIGEDERLLPLVGTLFSFECQRPPNRPRYFKKVDVPMKDVTRVNEKAYEHSFRFECRYLAGGSIVYVKYQSYNKYQLSEWSPVVAVKTQFKSKLPYYGKNSPGIFWWAKV